MSDKQIDRVDGNDLRPMLIGVEPRRSVAETRRMLEGTWVETDPEPFGHPGVEDCNIANRVEGAESFATGAVRCKGVAGDREGKFPARFDLIPPLALRALAEVYGEGAEKYGDRNWEKGFPESVLLNHMLAHVNNYIATKGKGPENDLTHALFNLVALIHFRESGRNDLMDVTGVIV